MANDHHKQAAHYFEQAAKSHIEAHKHHVEGKHELAALHAHRAHGYTTKAMFHSDNAALDYLEQHSKG